MFLTDIKIRNAKSSGKTTKLNDGDGLYLIIRPNGSKHWQLRYRHLEKEKTLSLGKYPVVGLSDARNRRIDALRLLEAGTDPSLNRKQERKMAIYRDRNSFGAVAAEWLERNVDVWTPRHVDRISRRLKIHVLTDLGRMPVGDITPLELLAVIQKVEISGAGYTAHRTLQLCGNIFDFAIITGRAQHNIALGLTKALKPVKGSHHPTLSVRELPDFLKALNDLNTTRQNHLAFRILLQTALRTGELRHSQWRDIDWENREWRVRPEVMKMRVEHIVPLSSQVLSHLRELQCLTGGGAWLFPNQQGAVHPVMSENTINHMIQRMGYKGRIVGHGFRSLFSTVANEQGFNRDAIERQLAHSERNQVRAAYNRAEYLDERRVLMQWWADFLGGKEPDLRVSGNAVPLATEELPRKYLNEPKVITFKAITRF